MSKNKSKVKKKKIKSTIKEISDKENQNLYWDICVNQK